MERIGYIICFWMLACQASFSQCDPNVILCTAGVSPTYTFINTAGPGTTYANPVGCSTGLFTPTNQFAFITLYITQSGNLNMLVNGNATTGFLDVIVYNIPPGQAPCVAVMNSANEIACNYATNSSGCVQIGTTFPCPSSIGTVSVTAGQVLMVIVNNYSGISTAFDLSLSSTPGSAQTGPPDATVNPLTIPGLPINTICTSYAPVQLTAVSNGGAWIGSGVSPSGIFDPSVAGPGTHVINYSLGTVPCNSAGSTTLTVLPGPTVAVNSASICALQSATLTSTVTPGGGTYLWPVMSSLSSSNTASTVATPSVTTAYTLTYTIANGCAGTGTAQVVVSPIPVLTITNNSQVCEGSAINFTASTGAYSYTWTGPPSFSQTTSTPTISIPNALPNMSGTYTVVAASLAGCSITNTSTLNVIPTFSVATTDSISVCQGANVQLTASSAGTTSFNWSGPSAYTSTLQNPLISGALPAQSGIYTVTANFISGATTCTTSNVTTVSVTPAAALVLAPIPPICYNGTINLSSPTGDQYSWSGPASFTSAFQNPVIDNVSVANLGIYNVSVTTNGCVSTGSVNVLVYNPLSFMSLPRDTTLCFGKVGLLSTNGGLGGSGSYHYGWSPVTNLSSSNAQTTLVSGQSTTTYTLTLSDANCPVTPTQTTAVTVSVNPTPVITFSTSNARGCEPFCTDLISSSNPPSVNCSWKFSTNLSTNSCNTSSFCFPIHGSYDASLTVTDVNGCVDSISQSAFIMVDPKPVPSFEWSPTNPTVLINQVNYTDLSTVGLPMQSWFWNFGDDYASMNSDTSSQQHPFHVYDNAGTYMVSLQVVNAYGCQQTVTKLVNVEEEFALFIPNAFSPGKQDGVNDNFNVKGIGFLPDEFEMAIYDRWGTQVFKTNDLTKGWDGLMKNGSKALPGSYVYKIGVKDYHKRHKDFLGYITLL